MFQLENRSGMITICNLPFDHLNIRQSVLDWLEYPKTVQVSSVYRPFNQDSLGSIVPHYIELDISWHNFFNLDNRLFYEWQVISIIRRVLRFLWSCQPVSFNLHFIATSEPDFVCSWSHNIRQEIRGKFCRNGCYWNRI